MQSTNQRKKDLAINDRYQLCQPELLTTGPAVKVTSGKCFSAGTPDYTCAATSRADHPNPGVTFESIFLVPR